MAGTARPSDDILINTRKEMTNYEIISYSSYNCSNPNQLFDNFKNLSLNDYLNLDWRTRGFDFNYSGDYLKIKICEPCNLYVLHADSQNGDLTVSPQTYKYINNKLSTKREWELYISGLEPGTYVFKHHDSYRTDYEWFFESVSSPIVLKSNNKYYSIKEKYYNSETKKYTYLSNILDEDMFYPNNLFSEITIENETFKPIDKFDSFNIISKKDQEYNVIGVKSTSELIVANDDIDTTVANIINSFTLTGEKIKLVVSLDKGKTWNTYTDKLIPLNVNIPLNNHNNLTNEEKEQWDIAKNIIISDGFTVDVFNSIDFNSITADAGRIRFAYVLENADSIIENLFWNFDAKGCMRKMKNCEYKVRTYIDTIFVTPMIDTTIMNMNIMI